VLAHVALSVSGLDMWRTRATDQQIEIVAQPAETHGFKSFFVRGPDGVLIELVEAAASKELCP
jgi:catechol 2,3-dioxygenase-like lactoylglutathione lyase family enzyme